MDNVSEFYPGRTQRAIPKWLALTLATIVTTFLVFVTVNRYRVQWTLARMKSALADVTAAEITIDRKSPDGEYSLADRIVYQDGNWRNEHYIAPNGGHVSVSVGANLFRYIPESNVTTKSPTNAIGLWGDPIETWKPAEVFFRRTNLSELDQARSVHLESRPDLDGRPVYAFVAQGNNDRHLLEVLVDRRTNLPIQSKFWIPNSAKSPANSIDRYVFNQPKIVAQFVNLPVPIDQSIDLPKEQTAQLRRWQKPIGTVKLSRTVYICDLRSNDEGDLYMVYRFPRVRDPNGPIGLLPTDVDDGHGNEYLRMGDMMPGGPQHPVLADTTLSDDEYQTAVTRWIPTKPLTPATKPKTVSVNFIVRSFVQRTRNNPDEEIRSVKTVLPITGSFKGEFPEYATVLELDREARISTFQVDSQRASYFESNLQFDKAIPWRKKAFNNIVDWMPQIADRWLSGLVMDTNAAGHPKESAAIRKMQVDIAKHRGKFKPSDLKFKIAD